MLVGSRFHLSYCTNIHPGPDWKTTFEGLKEYVPLIKDKVNCPGAFGLGLRLSNQASLELAKNNQLEEFKVWLAEHNSYVFTMNGFPYGQFHGTAVKDKVHLPDWTSQDRYDYTIRLFGQLKVLVVKGGEGGISTSPISYKHWFNEGSQRKKVLVIAAEQLASLAMELRNIEEQSETYLHLDIEPEPDGLLENSKDVIDFYKDFLLTFGASKIRKELELGKEKAEEILLRYICICYDVCHFALAFEEPQYTFERFAGAGIRVGKIQISAALKVLAQSDPEELFAALSQFNEPTYLHQVTQLIGDQVITYPDLPEVLKVKPDFEELRAHFHVPIFLEAFDGLFSTQDHILKVLDYIQNHDVSRHLEVETYTWDVLPGDLKSEISSSIARELNWTLSKLQP